LAAAICEEKKGEDTRILELDPVDSGLSDFFLVTSATNERQATAIADEIELRLKREFGVYAHSVEGRRVGEWILLDYVDFVVHVFLAEKRAFYDIERLRKSAKPFTPAEFDAHLKEVLAANTVAAREKAAAKTKPAAAKKAKPAAASKAKKPAAKKAVAVKSKPTAKAKTAAKGKAVAPVKKAAAKVKPAKAAAKKAAVKKSPAKKVAVKKAPAKKAALKKAPAKAIAKKAAVKKVAAKKVVKKTAVKKTARKK
jgi:ribosome-associated protein